MPSLICDLGQIRRRLDLLFLALLGAVTGGCSRPPAATDQRGAAPVVEARDDSLKLALEQFHEAKELSRFREALNQISGPLLRQPGKTLAPLDAPTRLRIQESLGLDAAAMDELDAGSMRPLDAAHLESCFLFRDAARSLEAAGWTKRAQALAGFAWVMRRVLLYEQSDAGVPPHLVLLRGWGDARDRALVALELLRQWQFDGCLIAVPTNAEALTWLVGVVIPAEAGVELALFDPRLGSPLPGPKGQPIATLADVRADPNLLQSSGIDVDQFKKADGRWPWAFTAAAPRMKALEEALSGPERVFVHVDFDAWTKHLTNVGLPAARWPTTDHAAPARRSQLFYPPADGGLDQSQRRQWFIESQAPMPHAAYQLERMRVVSDELREVKSRLYTICGALFMKYDVEPQAWLVRGQHEAVLKRVEIMGNALEQAEFAQPLTDAEQHKNLLEWQQRARQAYLAGDAKVKEFWLDDAYCWQLLRADAAVPIQKLQRGMLTQILLEACREPLGHQIEWLRAACWEDKAIRLQTQADAKRQSGKESRSLNVDAQGAWRNTRSAWARFMDRADLAPTPFHSRLQSATALCRQTGIARALGLGLAEKAHFDLHRAVEARVRQAEANYRLGETALAKAALTKARDDLTTLGKVEEPRKWLIEGLGLARAQPVRHQTRQFELLLRDWGPDGNLASLQRRVDRLLDAIP